MKQFLHFFQAHIGLDISQYEWAMTSEFKQMNPAAIKAKHPKRAIEGNVHHSSRSRYLMRKAALAVRTNLNAILEAFNLAEAAPTNECLNLT
jgi:hypothetical protein